MRACSWSRGRNIGRTSGLPGRRQLRDSLSPALGAFPARLSQERSIRAIGAGVLRRADRCDTQNIVLQPVRSARRLRSRRRSADAARQISVGSDAHSRIGTGYPGWHRGRAASVAGCCGGADGAGGRRRPRCSCAAANSDANKVLIDGIPAEDVGGRFDFGTVSSTGIGALRQFGRHRALPRA